MRIFLLSFFLLQNTAQASLWHWIWPETPAAREQRLESERLLEEAKRKVEEFRQFHRLGRVINPFNYTEEHMNQDTQRGWQLIVLVDRGAQSLTRQSMRLYLQGKLLRQFVVSTSVEGPKLNRRTGKKQKVTTPLGRFWPIDFKPNHTSSSWGESMPYSVFFYKDWAIHGVEDEQKERNLGQRASAGCVRMLKSEAAEVYRLLREYKSQSLIVITDFDAIDSSQM